MSKELRRSLRRDRRKRVWNVSKFIEERLDVGDVIGAFDVLKNWYKKFTGKNMKPSVGDLEDTRKVYEKLFKKDELTDDMPFDFDYDGPEVDDSIPSEEEIKRALFRMRSRKSPGLSLISVDQLKEWCLAANQEKPDEKTLEIWMRIVEIVRRSFELGDVPRAFFNGILVIIPKDDVGGKRGLGLLETLHKLNSQITNLRMANSIIFSQDVHGFRRQRGTFTAIGEVKLRMQMATCKSKTICQVSPKSAPWDRLFGGLLGPF